jgi:hypothetical protein
MDQSKRIDYTPMYYIIGSQHEEQREATVGYPKAHIGFSPLAGDAVGPLRLRWPWGLGGVADHDPSLVGGFSFF